MDYENKNSTVKKSLLSEKEDVNLSSFRRRNKTLIVIFIFLIISLTVFIGTLIIFLVPNNSSQPYYDQPPLINPAVESFCKVSDDKKSCLGTFNPIISPKSKTNPNQIFILSLQTASQKLNNIIPLLSISHGENRTDIAFSKCSVFLRDGLSRIREALKTMRVNPLVENQSEEQMIEMMNWIYAAWEDLESCIDDLDEAAESESTAVSAVKEKVVHAKVYVDNGQYFLRECGRILQIFSSGVDSGDRGLNMEIVFSVCICGMELIVMFVLFWSLFRIR